MTRLRLLVLGAAAGGGYPQWNCRCDVCSLYWAGDPRVRPLTQSSVAVTGDGEHWALLNCSPDVRAQILARTTLQPRRGRRDSPISAVVLTNGDIDHVAGLLSLRESQPYSIYATGATLGAIASNPVFGVVSEAMVPRRRMEIGRPETLPGGIEIEAFPVPGKVPLYQESGEVEIGRETDQTVGLRVSAGGRTFFYVPGCAHVPPSLGGRLKGAPLVLFDGTLYRDEEMIEQGLGSKTGRRMGHISMSGAEGSLAALEGLGIERKIFIHINNTNPVLIEGSPERANVEARGWEVAYDGMEIEP